MSPCQTCPTLLTRQYFLRFRERSRLRNALSPKAHDEMVPMRLGQHFSFALKRNNLRARPWDCLGRNDRLDVVLRRKTRRQRLAVQHDAASRKIGMLLRIGF